MRSTIVKKTNLCLVHLSIIHISHQNAYIIHVNSLNQVHSKYFWGEVVDDYKNRNRIRSMKWFNGSSEIGELSNQICICNQIILVILTVNDTSKMSKRNNIQITFWKVYQTIRLWIISSMLGKRPFIKIGSIMQHSWLIESSLWKMQPSIWRWSLQYRTNGGK